MSKPTWCNAFGRCATSAFCFERGTEMSVMLKKLGATTFVLLLAISATVPHSRAADVFFINGGDFNTAANWSDGMLPSLDLDNHIIQNALTSTYSAGTLSLRKLVVSDSTAGTFNMTGGDLTLAGGGDSLQIGRSLNSDP